MGWSGKKNGELLTLMAGQNFDALLTVDQSIRHQQNILAAGVGVVVLCAVSNRLADLVLLMPSALAALNALRAGEVVEISR